MELNELVVEPLGNTYRFIRRRSDGEPLETLRIHTNESGVIIELGIENGADGDCTFSNDGRLVRCNAWETEEDAQKTSAWSRHYTKRVGMRIGSHVDAAKICASLEGVIQDNYLRWIIRQFPGKETAIQFESSFYQVATKTQHKVRLSDSPSEPIEGLPRGLPTFWRSFGHKRLVWVMSVLMLGLSLAALLLSWQRNHKRDVLLKSFEAQRLIQGEVLPAAYLLDRKFGQIAGAQNQKKLSALSEPDRRRVVSNLDTFLDEIAPLERTEQLAIFHNSVVTSERFGIRYKANALREFHKWNLLSIISRKSSDPTEFVYDYLASQLFREKLLSYLIALIAEYPSSELAIEALLILDETIAIQYRAARLLLFDGETYSICSATASASLHAARAAAICATREKYKAILPQDSEDLNKRFSQLRRSVLEFAEKMNVPGYRQGDIQFLLADMIIEASSDYMEYLEALDRMRSIRLAANDIMLHAPYARFQETMKGLAVSVQNLQNQSRLEKRLQQLRVEQNLIEGQLKGDTRDMQLIRDALRQAWYTSDLEKVKQRYERARKRGEKMNAAQQPAP